MLTQNLIIYKFSQLYHILEEIKLDLNFNILFADNENILNDTIKNLNNYLIITDREYLNIDHQFVLNETPVNISKFVEKLNIEFLKVQFNNQSELKVNNYIIDFNSRNISFKNKILKLTEKEINTITYLAKVNKPVSIDELQENVWSYQSDAETHTVETHIYRLRKKISNLFNDNKFIISKKNGYQI